MAHHVHLRDRFANVTLVAHDATPADAPAAVPGQVAVSMQRWLSDTTSRRALLDFHAALTMRPRACSEREVARVGRELVEAIRRHDVSVVSRPIRRVIRPVETLLDVLEPDLGPDGWIEIRLFDEDGNPVSGEEYRVECEDGRVRTGTLNAMGKAREEGLHEGTCKVSFPRLDAPDWKLAG